MIEGHRLRWRGRVEESGFQGIIARFGLRGGVHRSSAKDRRHRVMARVPSRVRIGVKLAQRSLAREDRDGHRDLLLKTFDAFGIGFDS